MAAESSISEQSSLASDHDLSDVEDDQRSLSPLPPRSTLQRPPRQRTVPAKFRDAEINLQAFEEVQLDMTRSAVVKCSQTGKSYTVKLRDLSREDCEPLTTHDCARGSDLMVDIKGKAYPVKFIQFKDVAKSAVGNQKTNGKSKGKSDENSEKAVPSKKDKSTRKRPLEVEEEEECGRIRDKTNVPEILAKAKNHSAIVKPPKKKQNTDQENTLTTSATALDNGDKDLLITLAKKIEKLEKMTIKMMDMLNSSQPRDGSNVKVKREDDGNIVNGVNVMRLPSRDCYSFGLQLLDIMFTKEELATSLLFKSKKSERAGLDKERVESMLQLIEKRYGSEWDLRVLTQKVNQKCRD